MEQLHSYQWEYIIRLPKKKLAEFTKILNKQRLNKRYIHGNSCYRNRQQDFYWQTNITHGYQEALKIHLVGCDEHYEVVNRKTGEIEKHHSTHTWISSIEPTSTNAYECFNEGARMKELIEDNMNTEKNRGYHYKHAFSYNWQAMQGFHYLMRLGHAINAISEFSKKLKKYIKSLGVNATLKLIKETLFNPWLPIEWYEQQTQTTPQLRLQLE